MPTETLLFALKVFISAVVIAGTSSLAGRYPTLAGFVVALPISTILALSFTYWQTGSGETAAKFGLSILVAIPASLLFFLPLLFYGRFKGSFWPYMGAGVALLYVSYFVQKALAERLIDRTM